MLPTSKPENIPKNSEALKVWPIPSVSFVELACKTRCSKGDTYQLILRLAEPSPSSPSAALSETYALVQLASLPLILAILPNLDRGAPLLSSVSPSDNALSLVRRRLSNGGEAPLGGVPDAELLMEELEDESFAAGANGLPN